MTAVTLGLEVHTLFLTRWSDSMKLFPKKMLFFRSFEIMQLILFMVLRPLLTLDA